MSPDLSVLARHQPWRFRFCLLALVFTTCVLFAGGFTTSIQAGMAFKDWPTSNGSFNPPGWIADEDMRAEHSHRLLAESTGLLALIAMVWFLATEKRPWVRRIAIALVVVIILQGLLGGSRVLFDQQNTGTVSNLVAQTFAVLHAAGAEVTLCLWVTLAAASSRAWMVNGVGTAPVSPAVRRWAHAAVALLFIQIVIGAVMRHGRYALTIPYFPWSGPAHELLPQWWSWGVAVNFAHRVGAALASIGLLGLAISILRDVPARRQLGRVLGVVLALLVLQILLGAWVIWDMKKTPDIATTHMLVGAFLLASTWLVTLLAYRAHWWPSAGAEYAQPAPPDTSTVNSAATRPV